MIIIANIISTIEEYPASFGILFALVLFILSIFTVKEIKYLFSIKSNVKKIVKGNTINNYYYSPDVSKVANQGDALENPNSARKTVSLFEEGLLILKNNRLPVTSDNVDFIGDIYSKVFCNEGVCKNGTAMIRGAICGIGSKNYGNSEWKEHAASSVREILHKWKGVPGLIFNSFDDTFNKCKKIDFPALNGIYEDIFYERMKLYYSYFSGKCHYDENRLHPLQGLLNDKFIKLDSETDEIFMKVFFNFFEESRIFMEKL